MTITTYTTGPTSREPPAPHLPIDPTGASKKPKIKRNKLACIVSAIVSVLAVSLAGFAIIFIWQMIAIFTDADVYELNQRVGLHDGALFQSFGFTILVSVLNFYVAPISIPIALAVIGFTIGRLPHKGEVRMSRYMRQMALNGAALVGLTCGIVFLFIALSELSDDFLFAVTGRAGGLFLGGVIGGGAGALVGFVHVMILRPRTQIATADSKLADVFD